MGKGPRPDDWTRQVREHHPKAVAWVVAATEPCLSIREKEVSQIKRVLQGADFENLPDHASLPDSWLIAIIVCPGDDLTPVIRWTERLEAEAQERVQFYYHPEVEITAITEPWLDAGLPEPITYEVEDFTTFHNQFGWEFNDQVYRDATGWSPPG